MGRRFQQPQGPVQVDWANPLARGLAGAYGTQFLYDAVRGVFAPVAAATVQQSLTQRGVVIQTSGGGYATVKSGPLIGGARDLTIAGFVTTTSTVVNGGAVYCERPTSGNPILKMVVGRTSALNQKGVGVVYRNDAGVLLETYQQVIDVTDGVEHFVSVVKSGTAFSLYTDGLLVGSSTFGSGSDAFTAGSIQSLIGNDVADAVSSRYTGTVGPLYLYTRALGPAELSALKENPWQLFRPISSRTWFLMTGGGGANSFAGSLADGADTLAGAVSPLVAGSSATTDGADALLSAVSPVIASTLATTDGADVLASSASPVVSATSAPTDGADVLAASVSLTNGVDVSGLLVDGADTLSSNVGVVVGFSVAASDGPDALSAVVSWPDLSNSKRAGDAGKDYKHKKPKNHRDEVRKAILEAMEGPKVLAEQVREAVKPYASSETVSVQSLDWSAIEADIERVQAVIDRAKKKFQDDEEEALLLLMT